MKDKNGQDRRRKSRGDDFEIGEIRVFYNSGPDAEDRLRRLFALIVRYATADRQATPAENSPTDSRPADDATEA